MKAKRFLSLLLAGLMLTACGTTDDPSNESAPKADGVTAEEETGVRDDLPDDLNFDDMELTVACNKRPETLAEVAVSGITGEPVNDAVFERNMMVEKRLGVKITSYEEDSGIVDKVATSVKAGTAEYDAMTAECYLSLPKTLEGVFANLKSTPYLDLTQPWWSQGLNETISFQDSQYVATGSMLLSMYRFGFVTVFNKQIFQDANQTMLYEYVENGTWTLDKQIELVPLFHRDNGNGEQDTAGDVYGFVSTDYTNIDAYWSACQIPIVGKNEDNEYEMVFDTERIVSVVDKLIHLYHKTDNGMYSFHQDSDWPSIRQLFADGYAAMASFRLLELENESMRNMEDEFGVVPIPKFDVAQKEYKTLLHDQFTIVAIPTTVRDKRLDAVSATLEALSSTGYRVVKPVYYEDTLRTKIAKDPQTAEMMDIIVDGIYIDAGIIYVASLEYFHHELRAVVSGGQNNAISKFKTKSVIAEKKIKQINIRLSKLTKSAE